MGKTNLSSAQRAALAHNTLIGLAVCIQKHATTIIAAETSTVTAKARAQKVVAEAYSLEAALRAGRRT